MTNCWPKAAFMHSLWRISWQALPGGGAIDVFTQRGRAPR